MAGDRVEFARRLIEVWNSGDYDRWHDEVGPDLEFAPDPSFPDAGTYTGEDFRRWMSEWAATWGENRFEMLDVEEVHESLLIRGRWHLLTRESGDAVPAGDFTMVLFYPDADAERPHRMEAYFDSERAMEAARAGPG